jgi:hypothetical protein
MPQDVICRVEQMARKLDLGLSFGDRCNNTDTEDDKTVEDDAFSNDAIDKESTGVNNNDDIQLENNVNKQHSIDLPADDIPTDLPGLQTPVYEYDSDDEEEDDDDMPSLTEHEAEDSQDAFDEDETLAGGTTRSGRVVKQINTTHTPN